MSAVYVDTFVGRLAAEVTTDDPGMVAVWRAGGPMIGHYKLERFEGGVVTARTMRGLFGAPIAGVGHRARTRAIPGSVNRVLWVRASHDTDTARELVRRITGRDALPLFRRDSLGTTYLLLPTRKDN